MLYFGKYVLHNAAYLRIFKVRSCSQHEIWGVGQRGICLSRYAAVLSQNMRHNAVY